MFNLFKRKESSNYNKDYYNEVLERETPKGTKKQTVNEIIEEIHETFYTEVDRIIADTNQLKSLETNKQSLIDKRDKLVSLGFSNTKECIEANEEIKRLNSIKSENSEKESINKAARYFSFKYPHYKFITEESVKKICQKYNLVYGEVSKYIGTVPDLNLKQIQEFKIKEEDECYARYYEFRGSWSSDSRFEGYLNKKIIENKEDIDSLLYIVKNPFESGYRTSKCPLEIAAPIKDFNLDKHEIKDFKISKIEIPDPVVLAPVCFQNKKYYLIVTAWGIEASDPLVINEKMN